MLLIWDFAVDQTQTAAAEAPKVPTRETLPAAPLLDVRLTVHCKCSLFPEKESIIKGAIKQDFFSLISKPSTISLLFTPTI